MAGIPGLPPSRTRNGRVEPDEQDVKRDADRFDVIWRRLTATASAVVVTVLMRVTKDASWTVAITTGLTMGAAFAFFARLVGGPFSTSKSSPGTLRKPHRKEVVLLVLGFACLILAARFGGFASAVLTVIGAAAGLTAFVLGR